MDNIDILEFFKEGLKLYVSFETKEINGYKFYYIVMNGKKLMVAKEEYKNFMQWLEK